MKIFFLTFHLLLIAATTGAGLYAQPSMAIRGTYAREEIESQVLYYADALGLDEQVHIFVSFTLDISADQSGFTQYRDARAMGGGHQVYIRINKRKGRSHQLMTLAHEMVHAQQFVMGKLKQCNAYHYSWQDGLCSDLRELAYHQRPWEKEAHAVSAKLCDQYKDHSVMAVRRTKRNDL